VRLLAGLGPRESTGRAYARAAEIVAGRLQALGYDVRRQRFRVPGGAMWGVRVPAGTTVNVVAEPAGFDAAKPHLLIGAHLDTVPLSPGANDNASGVAVMLEVARLAAATPPRMPVVFVAFGGEEPRRRPGDSHFGSEAYVAAMDRRARSALQGMISIDAVGVGKVVPVCTAGGSEALRRNVIRTAQKARVPTRRCTNRASDHLSFARAGLQAVLLGGASYRQYHAPSDRPDVVDTAALIRTVRLTWSFIR
jgi:aminopeptidase YwaD